MPTFHSHATFELAYEHTEGRLPGVVFLGGYRSDMTGSKATALEGFCKERGQQFTRFDYRGHGQSSGEFTECTIGDWASDAVAILDDVTQGSQILVGSSMGGWMMLLAALARPERVAGLVGIAAAPDFSVKLMWDALSAEQKTELQEKGVLEIPNDYDDTPYMIHYDFIESSHQHLLLDASIAIDCPVHLIHGMQDKDVPWQFAPRIAEALATDDVEITLVKNGGHRMSDDEQIAIILGAVDSMTQKITQA